MFKTLLCSESNKHSKKYISANMQIFMFISIPSILIVRSFAPVPSMATFKWIRPLLSVWSAPQSLGINFSHLLWAFIWQPAKRKAENYPIGFRHESKCSIMTYRLHDWLNPQKSTNRKKALISTMNRIQSSYLRTVFPDVWVRRAANRSDHRMQDLCRCGL